MTLGSVVTVAYASSRHWAIAVPPTAAAGIGVAVVVGAVADAAFVGAKLLGFLAMTLLYGPPAPLITPTRGAAAILRSLDVGGRRRMTGERGGPAITPTRGPRPAG